MKPINNIFLICVLPIIICSCSARQVVDTYQGATAQQLVTISAERAVLNFPQKDLDRLRGKKVFFEFTYLEGMKAHAYFSHRIQALLEYNGVELVSERPRADAVLSVFGLALGTDNAFSGLELPEMNLLVAATPAIKLFGVDMFRGVTRYFYFLHDTTSDIRIKSNMIAGRGKSDKYMLLFLSFTRKDF